MDINPLIVELNKYEEELEDSIDIALGLGELTESDIHVAHDLLEIKGKAMAENPFQEIAVLYDIPIDEVIRNIRHFINKIIQSRFEGIMVIDDIKFKGF